MADEYTNRQMKRSEQEKKEIPKYEPGKKRNFPFAGLVVVVIVVLIAMIVAFTIEPTKKGGGLENVSIHITNQTYEPPKICDEECKLEKAINETNIELCNKLNETNKPFCLTQVGAVSLDACISIEDHEIKKECIYKHAKEKESVEVCNNLQNGERESCILEVDPCYYGEYPEKNLCMALLNGDYRFCEGNKDCTLEFIKENPQAEACEELSDSGDIGGCKSIVTKADFCKDLVYTEEDQCYELYAKETENQKICDELSDKGTEYAFNCYTFFAIRDSNLSICDNIGITENRRWACHREYALEKEDLEACSTIDKYAEISKNNCYFDVAKKYIKPAICNNLEAVAHKRSCYDATILRQNVPSVEFCHDVYVDSWRNLCYTSIAKRELDESICNNIEVDSEKDLCLYNVRQQEKDEINE